MLSTPTIIITVILMVSTFALPRKHFLIPYILAACFIPTDQRILIMDLDFTVLRILVVVGVLRIWSRGELRVIKLNRFDKILLLWAFSGAIIYVARWVDMRALIYKCGVLFDVLGLYWLFRQNIRSWDNIVLTFWVLAVCSLILAPFVAYEMATGDNPFAVLGRAITVVRQGRYRCWASFPHSILLGLFWATLVPVFIALSKVRQWRYLFWAATAAAIFIVFASVSSTPLLTLAGTLCLFALFRYRCYSRQAVWGFCGLTFALHLVMKAPVWHLISRIEIISGSTGWHRYSLIDKAIRHFDEWAVLGTRSTTHWGWGMADVTNHYVLEAVRGGLISLILFIVLLAYAVRIPLRLSLQTLSPQQRWLAWGICVSVFGHCLSFLGVSYFGQIMMLLYLTFAIVAVIYEISSPDRNAGRHLSAVHLV